VLSKYFFDLIDLFYFLKYPFLMAPKKVTGVEKPKRKIIMPTVELQNGLITNWENVHVYRTWQFKTVWLSRP